MNHQKLFWAILIAAVSGVLVGGYTGQEIQFFDFLGSLFLNALKGLVIPLLFFSLISGISSFGDIRKMGKMGTCTLIYYMTTTAIAVTLGLVLVNIVEPGSGITLDTPQTFTPPAEYSIYGTILNFISPNLLKDAVEMNILPVIIFALVFGGVLTTLGERGKSVLEICETINEALLKIIGYIIYFAPIGVFGLVAYKFGSSGGWDGIFFEIKRLSYYSGVVLGSLLIHGIFILPLILFIVTKKNPYHFIKSTGTALITAFSTASSSATLPVTLEATEKFAKISPKSTRFVAPLGATINMDGTALYEAVAALFIAQVYGIELSLGAQIIIFLTATLAAIGAAGIPQAGLVTMVMVLQAVQLPTEGIALLLTIDWLLDRFRTTINVWGDMVGCAVVEKLALNSKGHSD